MGFFSANCIGCGKPMLSQYSVTGSINPWMSQVVVIKPGGQVLTGEYDGYGRVVPPGSGPFTDGPSILDYENPDSLPSCWHQSCWILAGRPESSRESDRAEDQGYFFPEGKYDDNCPLMGREEGE
jgi:hypothetical protein